MHHIGKIVCSAFISMNNSGELLMATLFDLTLANTTMSDGRSVDIGIRIIVKAREIPNKI
jgi:hypothetical protein